MSMVRERRAARRTTGWLLVLLTSLLAGACSDSPTSPTPPVTPGPTVSSISPSTGSTAGGTDITILGTSFSGTPTVMLGGVAATGVRVLGTTTIQAVTGAHAAGPADVVVTVGTSMATLAGGFTYVAPAGPVVAALSPTSGPTSGGTTVTITGTGFTTASTVTFGGIAAASVTYISATSLRAVTPARVAGVVDVRVTAGSLFGTLPGGFTYIVVANTLPVISSITVKGTRPNEPANFADLGEDVNVIAAVTDAETTLDKLTYAWTATAGTVSGTGRAVTWRAPATATVPLVVTLTLRVTEPLDGTLTQSVTASTTAKVHDSAKEIADMSVQFLLEFSKQAPAPIEIVRNFWSGCAGKQDELQDVTNNQANYKVNDYVVGPPTSSTVTFGGTCPFRNKSGDGCVQTPVLWKAVYKPTGVSETSSGIDQTTAVYRESRWWLCDSDFNGTTTNPLAAVPFIR
jgi:hypothetical protein